MNLLIRFLCTFNHTEVTTVGFNQSNYLVDERNGTVYIVLVLSSPLSNNITVKVNTSTNSEMNSKLFLILYT